MFHFKLKKIITIVIFAIFMSFTGFSQTVPYKIVGTGQTECYNNTGEITTPAIGQDYYGQAAFHPGNVPSYTDNGDGTITDNVTGLMWVQARGSLISWSDAVAGASTNNTAGYSDWRMPTIKETYSLIQFSGVNGPDNTDVTGYIPYIDDTYFEFVYGPGGSTDIGQRIIDCQDWTENLYVSTVMNSQTANFGVNFADGRIKGYNLTIPSTGDDNTKYVRYVRGNTSYGINDFHDNDDNTITDQATNLMWSKDDSQIGLNWPEALAWVQTQNTANYLGYNDWRMPDAKELQSIVDYTRSPETTNSPAIDVNFFNSTSIINEAGQTDYPYIWSSSVLLDGGPHPSAIYISFGRAMGYMTNIGGWVDVHGAGSQKSDFMIGDPTDYTTGHGPQGDAVRIYNYVRLVRDVTATSGINEINSIDNINIYPNPVTDICNIAFNKEYSQLKIVICNSLGSEIQEFNYTNSKNVNLDLIDLPKGVFVMRIFGDEVSIVKKFVKI